MKMRTAIFMALMAMTVSARAITFSPAAGPLIRQAQVLAFGGNYRAAVGKLNEADAVKSTPDDVTAITQLKQYVAGCISGNHPQTKCAPSQP